MSQPKFGYAAVLLSMALCAPAWGISKCTAPDGSVTFQDAPCSGQAKAAQQTNAAPPITRNVMSPSDMAKNFEAQVPAATAAAAQEKARYAKELEAETKKSPPPLALGMSKLDVEQLWGRPSRVSSSATTLGSIEIWHYPRGRYQTDSLTISNGKLTNITSLQH